MDSTENQLKKMLEELKSRTKEKVVLESGMLVVLQLFMVVGNSITLLIMVLNRRMRTIPNLFVASLAISDLGLGVFTSCPLALPTLATSQWEFSDVNMSVSRIHSYHSGCCIDANFSFDGGEQVFSNRQNQPSTDITSLERKTVIIILMSWLYAMCTPLPYVFSGYKMVFHPSKFFCYLQIDSGAFTAYLVSINVGIPTCIILYCYLSIYKTVRSHKYNFQLAGSAASTVNVEEINVTRVLFVTVVFYALCWAPILLIDLVDTIHGSWVFPREAYVAYSFLATVSSVLNPLIYGVLNKNFRKEYLRILCCRYCRSKATVQPSIIFVC